MEVILLALALAIFVALVFMIRALRSMRRVHATAIWLQMQQQQHDPKMVQALHTMQTLAQVPSMNGHGPSAPPLLMNGQLDAVQTVNRYFANVGALVRTRVLDEEQVVTLMNPLRDAWYASRSYRDALREKNVAAHADFDWLYTEWVNGEYRRRA